MPVSLKKNNKELLLVQIEEDQRNMKSEYNKSFFFHYKKHYWNDLQSLNKACKLYITKGLICWFWWFVVYVEEFFLGYINWHI